MIRALTSDNIHECVKLIRTSFQTVADEFGLTKENAPRFTAFAVDEAKILFWLEKQQRALMGYYRDDKLVGCYNLLIDVYEAELGSLCVLPEYRHYGIGSCLLCDAEILAKDLGCEVMKLSIIEENTVLRKWYESFGYVHTGTKKLDFFPFTCGYMEKELNKDGEL
ncbi:MAG: GNAT family N-acetyltransferase [Ruminococcus sp.]|nr:GNAT family N-acetyltransferase [Ruminococcus sp.]